MPDTLQSKDGESGDSRTRTRHGLVWLCLVFYPEKAQCPTTWLQRAQQQLKAQKGSYPINGHPSAPLAFSDQGRKVGDPAPPRPLPRVPQNVLTPQDPSHCGLQPATSSHRWDTVARSAQPFAVVVDLEETQRVEEIRWGGRRVSWIRPVVFTASSYKRASISSPKARQGARSSPDSTASADDRRAFPTSPGPPPTSPIESQSH